MSGEEKCECFIMSKVWILDLAHINSIDLGESTVHNISEWLGDPHGADVSRDSRGDSGERNNVFDLFVFLGSLVDRVKGVPDWKDLSEVVLNRFFFALRVGPEVAVMLHKHFSWDRDTKSVLRN